MTRTSNRIVAAVTGAAVAITGTVTGTAAPAPPAYAAPAAEPALQTLALPTTSGATPAGTSFAAPGTARAGGTGLAVAPRVTKPFSLLGATWTDPQARLGGTVQVRTRAAADGRWSAWRTLESDGTSPAAPGSADAGGRGSTDPVWVGDSDAVEARVATGDGTRPLPAGLRLDLINPDADLPAPVAGTPSPGPAASASASGASDSAAQVGGGSVAGTGRAAVGTAVAVPPRPAPAVVSRAGWRANEAMVADPPEYTTDVQVLFVHHTATSNDYSCADSARIVRGIQAYHVRSNGWNDIGYNFLVDKCGTLFEGRGGGVDQPVLGAHTLGFNSHSAAIAVIGDYTGRAVSTKVRWVIAQVAAYKIGMYGHLATERTALVSSGGERFPAGTRVTFNRVSGHRDAGRTACPGNALYGQLGTIRGLAGGAPAGFKMARMTGATQVGAAFYARGPVRPLWTTTTPTALLNRFDVIVDGAVVASAPRAHRTTLLNLNPGRHVVTVRAYHLSGRAVSQTRALVVDRTAPTYTSGPAVWLRGGSLDGSVPIYLRWTATDPGGLRSVTLTRPSVVALGTTARAWAGTATPGRPTTWSIRAADRAGNTRTATVTRTPLLLTERTTARTGRWANVTGRGYFGGSALRSITAGSSMTWTFTGSSASLAASRTPTSGRLKVYVDGRYSGVVDLRSRTTSHRMAVWARSWPASATHTVRVVVQGTTGRPGVALDGLVLLR
ncbi:N-acetylmuramoyl-L-alanine amidase [Krasilnikovia cinnamomea]|uniref:N-acetylmuramoyl-L-alanine amidase n=1 Tax=Krasilnikovia cinnamomea TaxID=349313 RepID=A0A4Q7ZGD6_9ACTN|nr:N-acetylmuramoyl-L-alanine amidase [Krasilnikovia cinnamomea]